ncbi:MAG: hypothetical protein KDC79_03430 [Cyclobacteriaceae bacterium]|nr:hypothetical protein [Cyclobacteriaceae bacterium]
MKQHGQKLKIAFYGLLLIIWASIVTGSSVYAQINKEKKIDKTFTGKQVLEVNHKYGDLEVRASNDNTVKVDARLSIEAKTEEDAQKVIDNFTMDFQEAGNKLTITTKFESITWNTINGRTSITFKDGTKVKGIENIELFFTLYVPKLQELTLSNKYDDIHIYDDLTTNLSVVLNSGVFQGENIKGNVSLDAKYSKMKLKNTSGNADINLYDTDVEMGNAQAVKLFSKYSGITMGAINGITHESYDDNVSIGVNTGELSLKTKYSEYTIKGATKANINSYDDVIDVGNVKGALDIETKYSNFKVGSFTNATIISNDDDFVMGGGAKSTLKAESKYSEFRIDKLDQVEFTSSYDDQFEIDQLGIFKASTKYGEFTIGQLEKSLSMVTNDDNLTVKQLGSGFTGATLGGKYSTFNLNIPSGLKYQLDAKLTYGKISYPEANFDLSVHIEKGSTKEIKGKVKGASDASPKITIEDAYDCEVYLN